MPNYEISHVRPVKVMKLWGWMEIPVVSCDEIHDTQSANSFFNISGYPFLQYGNVGESGINFFIGFLGRDLPISVEAYDIAVSKGVHSETVIDTQTFEYGTDGIVTRTVSTRGDSDGYRFGGVRYTFSKESLNRSMLVSTEFYENLGLVQFGGAASGHPAFLTFNENGIDYYIRTYYTAGNGEDRYPLNLSIKRDSNGFFNTFFGCESGVILTLNQIGGNPIIEDIPVNPFEPIGPSGPTDPDLPPGTFDDDSDAIPDSPLPTLSAANTGFTRIYNPTLSQVQNLAQYLWTTPDLIETIWNHIKQFFEDPMQAIIGFNLVPCPVPDGGTENFKLLFIDTGVSMTVAANQFVDVDCGTVQIKRYYGSALDQAPNTKITVFLPYIGMVQVNTDEVMGTTLQVKYRIDICSGSCVAKIFVDGSVIYQYSGHCAVTIPISSADFSTYVSAAINVAKLAVGAATAGASGLAAEAASIAGGASQQTNQIVEVKETSATERNPATGRQITTGTTRSVTTTTLPQDTGSTQASFSGLSPSNISNTVGQIMGSKPNIQHSGSFSGNSGYLGVRRPYVIIERPNMCMPANYQALNGFPAMITMELSTCKGFTRVQQVQLTGMTATNPEQAEILELLKGGVVF